jgi:DNA-3-methyladenine glycosylase II
MTPEALAHLSAADPQLKLLIELVGPCSLRPKRRSPFEALVQAVTYQQLNGKAAATILGRFKRLYPRRFPTPEDILSTSDEQLRSAGLSRAKTAAIKDIAAKTLDGIVPASRQIKNLSDEEIIERLTQVRGVGPWTVQMLLIFTLGRPDVMPSTDYGVLQGYARTFGRRKLPKPLDLLKASEPWRPHRSTAAWYFWRALELPEEKAKQLGRG